MPYTEPLVKTLSWQQVTVILGLGFMLLASVTILALARVDVAAIFGTVAVFVVAMASAFGISLHNQIGQVKDVANGRLTQALEQNKDLQGQVTALALRIQPPEETTKAVNR